jgi:hypothetical protein
MSKPHFYRSTPRELLRRILPIGVLLGLTSLAAATDRQRPPTNIAAAPVRDTNGAPINYDRETLEPMFDKAAAERAASEVSNATVPAEPAAFFPATPGGQRPFWQYAIFGSGIGASNIIIAPTTAGVPPEIVVNGNSYSNFGAANFWYVLQWKAAAANYEQVFVGPTYDATMTGLALGNVMGDAKLEIAVMLSTGRIYLYDLSSKTELGYITTGISNSLEALSLADLNADGVAEIMVATADNLFVFSGVGNLLWQTTGAGGYDMAVGQMDNDDALEIATTKGTVVDAATHAIQWTRSGGFGAYLKLAPIPGETYQQLIAAQGWDYVYSYDVARQLPRWSIDVFDIDAIEVGDVDNDGIPELIIGDGQWGSVHVHDLNTQAMKW